MIPFYARTRERQAGGQVKRIFQFVLALALGGLLIASAAQAEKPVVGWLEKVVVFPGGLALEAKVDTGADNTSLDARNITEINRNGRKFLRFDVDNRQGQKLTLEREQVGIELVPHHKGDDEERPVIILEICLGKECRNTLVNLVDRSKRKHPLLIGRSFLLDRVLVDPGVQHLAPPTAQERKNR